MDDLVPVGKYRARATNPRIELSQNDNEMTKLDFVIEDGPMKGRSVPYVGFWSEKKSETAKNTPAQRTVIALRATGWTGTAYDEYPGVGDTPSSIEVEHETYKGTVSARVKWVNAISQAAAKPVPDDRKKARRAALKGVVLATDKQIAEESAAPKTKSTGTRRAPVDETDDIPF